MLRHICILSCLILSVYSQLLVNGNESSDNDQTSSTLSSSIKNIKNSNNKINNDNSNNKKNNLNEFETSHKIINDDEFHTSHKILNERPIIKLLNDSELMQKQKPTNLLSTKERPELNSILSALINEDVMKSIESKRAAIAYENEKAAAATKTTTKAPKVKTTTITTTTTTTKTTPEVPEIPEKFQHPTTESAAGAGGVLTTPSFQLLSKSLEKDLDDDLLLIGNEGLVDQSINLEEAGSENNQKSRIQIKKGPNGVDYEYEYVYYYYDDDEKANGTTASPNKQSSGSKHTSDKTDSANENKETGVRGKSRYTNIDRSTTSAPDNEIVSSKAKGRSSIPVVEDVDEGRLPLITRFPPRSKSTGDVTPATNENEGNVVAGSGKKSSVRRPSLELVDSDTFNTDEKQVKTNRNLDSEITKQSAEKSDTNDAENDGGDEGGAKKSKTDETINGDNDEDVENTTPLMEKVAFDLYAILANENLNMDMTTDIGDMTTDLPLDSTDMGLDEEVTTISDEDSTPTTTTTTTTPEPTTTTTTTTTTPAPLPGRRGLSSGGRNRFRLKSGSSTTASTTEAPAASSEPEQPTKPKNRFQRPSFGSGRTTRPSANSASKESDNKEETVAKEEAKPVGSTNLRGRTRNRFNLRGSAGSTTEKPAESGAVDAPASTTARNLRARPTFNIRGRGRPGASTTAAPSNGDGNAEDSEKPDDKPAAVAPAPARPASRFALNRPGAATGGNRLLPRGRLNVHKTTPAASANDDGGASESEDEKKDNDVTKTDGEGTNGDGDTAAGDEAKTDGVAAAAGGLNRLKSRPRIQINPKTENKPKAQAVAVNRKPNPLLARRRIGGPAGGAPSTTTESATGSDDESENPDTDSSDEKKENAAADGKDETTEQAETSSELPKGLGLLGNRRRLPIRKPGTIL